MAAETMTVSEGAWLLEQTISDSGTISKLLSTTNKFVDKDIRIVTNVAAGALSAGATTVGATVGGAGSILTEESEAPASGAYITVTGQGSVSVGTAGWLAANTSQNTTAGTKIYSIQDAAFTVSGNLVYASTEGYVPASMVTPIASISAGALSVTGGALTAGTGYASASSDGYYNGESYDTTDKVDITTQTSEAQGYYKITASGYGTVSRGAIAKQITTAGYFNADSTPVDQIAADSENSNTGTQAYYILKSTLSASQITPATTAQTVTIGAGYYPTARTVTVDAMTTVTPTTSLANTGISTYFQTGTAQDNDVTITPQYSSSAGYIPASTDVNNGGETYLKIITTSIVQGTTTVSGTSCTRGTATWSAGWLAAGSMATATFANEATSGTTYVDITDTTEAPVLSSGGYLYINAGYVDNLRISLAKLIPDIANITSGDYILSGYSAYDKDGTLVVGTIQTYDGSYTAS